MAQIRKARFEDCSAIAQTQVDSYRNAYVGLFPPAYLDHFTVEEQTQDWKDWLAEHPDDLLLVALSADQQVMGYILARKENDIYPGYAAEVIAIHVRQVYKWQGVGRALFYDAVTSLKVGGCQSVMLWTLQKNPIREWYEKLGGKLIAEKSFAVDDWTIVEVAYGWEDLGSLQLALSSS